MKTYIGTKMINAQAMTRASYNAMRGWTLPADENGADDGYLVEYLDGGKPNHPDFEGYVSWSPKAQFDAAYLEIGNVAGMPSHQQRVVAEKAELDDRKGKLSAFTQTDLFESLPVGERARLLKQFEIMIGYSVVLAERIAAFSASVVETKTLADVDPLPDRSPTADQITEQRLVALGKTAPRLSPDDLQANIVDIEIVKQVTKGGQILRWAILTTKSGFAVVGRPSASVSAENDVPAIGEETAIANSTQEMWPLMGYELKCRLAAAAQPQQVLV